MSSDKAIVFDIQRFSLHDGPGIRTVVFLKGCGLSCAWCQNPEAMRPTPELAYYAERCIEGCDVCLDACPEHALRDHRVTRVDFSRCNACGQCVDRCPADALVQVGREMTVGAVLTEAEKDRSFYESSNGGVTLSGGEPLLQASFVKAFIRAAHQTRVHVAVETAGFYPRSVLESLLPDLDLILFDLKLMDPERHHRYTSRDNRVILDNLRFLVARGAPLSVRMPVVPGKNTDLQNITATATFLEGLGVRELTLLPYNHLWEAKLPRLSLEREPLGILPPERDFYRGLELRFAARGIAAHL